MEIIETSSGKKYKLKIKKEHYISLQQSINLCLEKRPNLRKEYINNGLSDERFRWDVLWLSGFNTSILYDYLNDTHIDTALKHILKWR